MKNPVIEKTKRKIKTPIKVFLTVEFDLIPLSPALSSIDYILV